MTHKHNSSTYGTAFSPCLSPFAFSVRSCVCFLKLGASDRIRSDQRQKVNDIELKTTGRSSHFVVLFPCTVCFTYFIYIHT